MIRLLIFVIALYFPTCMFAQEMDSSSIHTTKELYIKKYNDYLNVKISVTNNVDFFTVNSNPTKIVIKPNSELKTKLFLSYRFISFSVGESPDFLPGNNDNSEKGKSKILIMRLNMNFDHWVQNLSFKRTKGFYLLNSKDYIPD